MPRRLRQATGGLVYHVLNRGAGRARLFRDDHDYAAFERVMQEAWHRLPTRIVSYCLMPNHWHLVLWPRADGELSEFMRWLTVTHTQRWHAHRGTAGTGPLYQGRFKSFPIQTDEHMLTVCRYVERNALRAKLVDRADHWPWGSLRRRAQAPTCEWLLALRSWPVAPPRDWPAAVNRIQSPAETDAIRTSIVRGAPLGTPAWQLRTAAKLGLESALRPRGRPRIVETEEEQGG